jgi:hypothetical protein
MKKNPILFSADARAIERIYRILFFVLFGYAIARAFLVVPMLDELSTFFSYIRTGNYFNTIERIDANNHVLNSFFGHQFYRVFGDSFFLFRISSLLAFPVYFYSLKYIVRKSLPRPFQAVVFLALVCIPWIFEYFSYSRGYGLGIAFFFAAIAFTVKWKSSNNWKFLAAILICLWFSIGANLSYLLPALILVVYIEFLLILQGNFQKRPILTNISLVIAWAAATYPFLSYSFKLREAGALWWGNQEGLWESTGTSLSNLVLFTDERWVLNVLLVLLLVCLVTFIVSWIKEGFWAYLKQTEAIVFILLMVTLTGIVSMRYVLDVNYPMDRVAMYLVPLFLLSISMFVAKIPWVKYSLFALLFFPASFLFHLNLSTSIFSPEDRIPTAFSDQIKSNLTDETALSAEHVSHVSYAFSCRNDEKVHMAYTVERGNPSYADYHISWLAGTSLEGFSTIASHPDSKTGFMKREQPIQKELVIDTLIRNVALADEYFTILKRPIDSSLQNQMVQIQINAEMEFDQVTRAFNFIQTLRNDNNDVISAHSPKFNLYYSDRTDINFVFTDKVFQLKPEETHFHFFWMNADKVNVNAKFIRVRVSKVILPVSGE